MSTHTVPAPTDTEAERRAAVIDGLRQLAAWYEDHPDVPVPRWPEWLHCVGGGDDERGIAEVEQLATALAVPVEYGRHVGTRATFAGVDFRVYYCTRISIREYDARMSYHNAIEVNEPAAPALAGER